MAQISNLSSYPIIAPDQDDYFILTDAENNKATKNCSIKNLQTFLGVDTTMVSVSVSAANLKVLGNAAYTLLVAPGVGYAYDVTNLTVFLDAGSQVFDFSSNTVIEQGSGNNFGVLSSAQLNSATDVAYKLNPPSTLVLTENTAISLNGGNATTGDGTLYVNIIYRKVKLDSTF
jgi:hypothetical protein